MKSLEFYFDFSSPNAYFSAVQLRRLSEEHEDLEVRWNPVFLGGLMEELETTPPAMQNELKADYLMRDLKRWSDFYDISFDFPDTFPVNSLPALRTYLLLEEKSSAVEFAVNVFEACWADGEEISDEATLRGCLPPDVSDVVSLPGDINRDSVKNELKERTDKALERGVFGCPSFFVGDEMFWGKDRLDFVKRRLDLN